MFPKKGKVAIGVMLVLLALLLAACNKGDKPSAEQEEEPTEPVELVFFSVGNIHWWDEQLFMEYYGEPIRKKFPYIIPKTLTMQTTDTKVMNELMAVGQPIDIMLAANASYLSFIKPFDLHTNIEDLVKKHEVDLSKFVPEYIEMNRKLNNGVLTGLPLREMPTQLLYNKGIFDKFGVPYPPHDKWTWDEMFELAKKLNRVDGGTQYYGVRMTTSFFRRSPYSIDFVDQRTNKAIFNNESAQKMLNLYLRTFEGSDPNGLKADPAKLFFETRVLAMFIPVVALYATPERYVGLDWDIAPVPYLPEKGNVGMQPYPDYLYVSKISKHPDLAMKVIDYLTSETFQLQNAENGQGVPALKDRNILKAFGQKSGMFVGKNVNAMVPEKYAPPAVYDDFNNRAASTILPKYANQVRDGQVDVNTALRLAEEETNRYIAEQLQTGAAIK